MGRNRTVVLMLLFIGASLLSSQVNGQEIVLKYAFSNAITHPHGLGAQAFKDTLEELSKGRIRVSIFPSSQMGNEDELVDLLRMGSIQMSSNSGANAAVTVPELDIFGLPFLFRDYEHQYTVYQGPFRDVIKEATERAGLMFLGLTTSGFRQIFTRKPIRSFADMEGVSIRGMSVTGIIKAIEAMKAKPVPLPYNEVYMAIQQGVVDGGETSTVGYINEKFYEPAPYLLMINYMDTGRIYYMNRDFFASLPPDLQEAVLKAVDVHMEVTHKMYVEQEDEANETLKKLKVNVTVPDRQPFVDAMQMVYREMKPTLGEDWIRRIQETK